MDNPTDGDVLTTELQVIARDVPQYVHVIEDIITDFERDIAVLEAQHRSLRLPGHADRMVIRFATDRRDIERWRQALKVVR